MKAQIQALLGMALFTALTSAVNASTCTAEIKPGKSPYPHIKTNTPIAFHSYSLKSASGSPPYVKYLVGDRMLEVPVSDLKNISTGCSSLKQHIGD